MWGLSPSSKRKTLLSPNVGVWVISILKAKDASVTQYRGLSPSSKRKTLLSPNVGVGFIPILKEPQ